MPPFKNALGLLKICVVQEMADKWNRKANLLPPLTPARPVCELHFRKEDVIRNFLVPIAPGTVDNQGNVTPPGTYFELPRRKVQLADDAVPCNFPQSADSKYIMISTPIQKVRQSPVKKKKSSDGLLLLKVENEPQPSSSSFDNCEREMSDKRDELDEPLEELPPSITVKPTTILCKSTWSFQDVKDLKMPTMQWNYFEINDEINIIHINENFKVDKRIAIKENGSFSVFFNDVQVRSLNLSWVNSIEDAIGLLRAVDDNKVCRGTGLPQKPFSWTCRGIIDVGRQKQQKCDDCRRELQRVKMMELRARLGKRKNKESRIALKTAKRSLKKLQARVDNLKAKIKDRLESSAKRDKDILEDKISKLPPTQQETVRACFEASKTNGPQGHRFTKEWILQCYLLRNKSPSLYEEIRKQNILALPSRKTLSSYVAVPIENLDVEK